LRHVDAIDVKWFQPAEVNTEAYREARTDLCYRNLIRAFAVPPLSIPMVFLLLRSYVDSSNLVWWCASAGVASSLAFVLALTNRRMFGHRLWGFRIAGLLLGVQWGLLGWITQPTDTVARVGVIIMAITCAAVASASTAAAPSVFHINAIPLLALNAAYLQNIRDNQHLQRLAPFAGFYYLVLISINYEGHRFVLKALLAKLENANLLRELETEHAKIAAANGSLTTVNDQLTHRSNHDALTGLLNRVGLADRMNDFHLRCRDGSGMAVMYLDLDGFKLVNDTLGHEVGDSLLRIVGQRFISNGGHAALGRLGGDEFCAVFYPIRSDGEARAAAEHLRSLLDPPIVIEQRSLNVSVSIGVAVGYGEIKSEDLRRTADIALYRAKALGRNRAVLFDDAMQVKLSKVANEGAALRKAFDEGRVRPWYQPEIDLLTNGIVGAEALVRWQDGDVVRVAGEFLSIAEEVGLGMLINERVTRNVVRSRGLQHANGMDPNFRYWVNVSGAQLSDEDPLLAFLRLLDRHNTPGSGIGIEVTENALIRDFKQAIRTLEAVREVGVAVALDDFGTGHSSLSLLQRLPIDVVKIDRSFVRDIEHDPRDRTLVQTIVQLAHQFDLSVTAEGVENEHQVDILREMNCDVAQGFLYSAAVPEPELLALLSVADFSNQ
jgi:diguanylate cyclase (GGDEF)-like protein